MKKVLSLTVFAAALYTIGACSKSSSPSPEMEASDAAKSGENGASGAGQNGTDIAESGAGVDAENLNKVHFDFDSYTVNAPNQDILRKNAKELQGKKAKVQIEGHCDERGSNEYNLALGERRAQAVHDFLVSEGVSADSLSTISYGEERPEDPGHTESSWAKNRRAQFKPM